jgi:hypothetical protein
MRLFSDKDNHKEIVKNMKLKLNKENKMKVLIRNLGLDKPEKMEKLDLLDIKDFPKLSLDDIKSNITLGSYQLTQSLSYIGEHLNNGKYEILLKKIDENKGSKIICSLIQSRHSNANKYKAYVKYKPLVTTVESIESYYCTCKNGLRTVGCCSHECMKDL